MTHCINGSVFSTDSNPRRDRGVRQHPSSLGVMRGETATLSCHFKVESLKCEVQRFKMKSEKQLISNSSRQIAAVENQTSSLAIANVAVQDPGWYQCEVSVLKGVGGQWHQSWLCWLRNK